MQGNIPGFAGLIRGSPLPRTIDTLTTAPATAQDRIYRHQHAAEVLRARSVLVVACTLWLVVGGGLDLATHHAIGSGSLWFVLTVRLVATGFHIAVVAPLFRTPLPAPRVAMALAASVFPVTSFALMLIATHMGGLASPYVTAVFVAIAVQAVALPWPWQRGAALVAVTTLIYPVGLLVATRFDDGLRAQLHDDHSMFVFAIYVAVLIAGAIVVAWGGHVIWSLRQSVFESRKLGRYRLLKKIGQGGMGEVWRAEDRALRRRVALKILSPEHGRKPSRVARFEREIQATASIVHPNVIRIHDWGVTDDGVWYYAMDLLEGEDLATIVKRCGPMPAELAVHLFVPAATGLGEAHRIGIVHRDVKPGNMFVVAPGNEPQRLELLDFGIADIGDDAELTAAGAVLGTPGYMAPEVTAGGAANVAADIYGFAAAMFYALTGRTPRDAGGLPASALVPGIPAAVDDALVRALDADPSRRHATANELAGALSIGASAWTGSWKIDREAPVKDAETVEKTTQDETGSDATGDTEALETQVEARVSSSRIPRSRSPSIRK
jgi:serine/threonine-protein kinase